MAASLRLCIFRPGEDNRGAISFPMRFRSLGTIHAFHSGNACKQDEGGVLPNLRSFRTQDIP